jgi:hypothetical protein
MAIESATFICVEIVLTLMYFTKEGRIDAFQGEFELYDWLELSENRLCTDQCVSGGSATDNV